MLMINHKQRPWGSKQRASFSEVCVCHSKVSNCTLCVSDCVSAKRVYEVLYSGVFMCEGESPWLQSYICHCGPPPRLSATGAADSTPARRRLSSGGSSAVAYSSLSSLWVVRDTLLIPAWKLGCQQQHKKGAGWEAGKITQKKATVKRWQQDIK